MRAIWTGLLIALCAGVDVRADVAPGNKLSPEQAASRLSDSDPRVREEAEDALRSAGAGAEAALRGVAESGNPEAARRARALLREVRQPAPEELPEVEPAELGAYRTADAQSKAQIIQQLAGSGGYRAGVLVRMWAEEQDPDLRATMFRSMVQAPAAHATALIARGSLPTARRLLETALEQGDAEAAASYAALCMFDGRLDDALARWSARPRPAGQAGGDDEARARIKAVVQCHLHRAAGDARKAVEFARKAGDAALIETTLLDAADWPALADHLANGGFAQQPFGRPRPFGLLAGVHHLAGDKRGFNDVVDRMRKNANPDTADDLAHTLLLAGDVEQGMRALADANRAIELFKLLGAREQWDEAFALVSAQDAKQDQPAMELRVAAAEQLHWLGEEPAAFAMLDRVAEENRRAQANREIELMLGDANRRAGRTDKAWDHYLTVLKATPPREAGQVAWRAFQLDLDGDGDDEPGGGDELWQLVIEQVPGESIEKQFEFARSLVERKLPLEETEKLVARAGAPQADNRHRVYASQLVRVVAKQLDDAGRRDAAETFLAGAAERAPAPQYARPIYMLLGDRAAERREWVKASNWYARAWNLERDLPGPLYLRAWALREAGFHSRAGELMNLALVTPLANARRRLEGIRLLQQHRLDAALPAEISSVLRTVRGDVFVADYAHRADSERALRKEDWLAAAACYEYSLLNLMSYDGLADAPVYLRLPHTVHRLRARGLLARRDIPGAEREIAICRALLPGETSLPIDVVAEFERLENKARADELYDEAMRAHDAVLAKYPRSANHHNNAAWLATNVGRDSEKALKLARRAVELRPKNAAYVDTLAEVEFRRGAFDEAIRQMKRCIELEPRTPRHREQLERFEAGKRGEVRAMPPG
jgi:tetratricopeptide (TPR) repeat protein